MEIVSDLKIGNIEVTNSLGINFSNSNSRIKHTGNDNLTIKTVSGKIIINNDTNTSNDSIKLNSSLGGITMESSKQISIQTTDTTNGIKIGTENNVPITLGSNLSINSISNNFTLDNDDNNVQYIYLNYNATSTNNWRIFVNDSNGKLTFQRYNGSSWITKWSLE